MRACGGRDALSMPERIALFGGSFNPIHHGHLIVAGAIREQMGLDRVVFVPAARPPHKAAKELAPSEDRWRMVRLAIEGEPGFGACDRELRRAGPSYTIDTVLAVRQEEGPQTTVYWIVGGDWIPELPSWHRASELVDACRIVTVGRPGWDSAAFASLRGFLSESQIARLSADVARAPLIEISSTEIRKRVAAGHSIRYLVPESVRGHIESRGLYRP